MHTVRIL